MVMINRDSFTCRWVIYFAVTHYKFFARDRALKVLCFGEFVDLLKSEPVSAFSHNKTIDAPSTGAGGCAGRQVDP